MSAKPAADRGAVADIPELTSLRFFAALSVLFLHLSQWDRLPAFGSAAQTDGFGVAVDLFFMLSGFVLAHVYFDRFDAGELKYKDFIWFRVARVYPLHLVTLVFMVAAMSLAYQFHFLDSQLVWGRYIVASLLMVHSWGYFPHVMLNWPAWSISCEWFVYLTFPIFMWLTQRGKARPVVFVVISLAIVLAAAEIIRLLGGGVVVDMEARLGLLRVVPGFLFGCGLFVVSRKASIGGMPAALGLILCALTIVGLIYAEAASVWTVLLAAAILFFAVQLSKSEKPNPLRWPVFLYLGETSYSLYMVHQPVFFVMFNVLLHKQRIVAEHPLAAAISATAAAFATASLSYHLIERPARRRLRRIGPPPWSFRRAAREAGAA